MMITGDMVTLSSGRQFYANRGLLSPGGDGELFEGYDGDVGFWNEEKEEREGPTPEERREIAEFMVERWKRWGKL